ncbi:preprotein translocase subunit SecE [Anaplasma phagocytophilum]|uniref:Protein translocase subunit SecE n=10 Tax=Anaplasma phagocytophilum TaxID=948 RepID=A0AA45UT66_ANAPH|nr:preprotein translocase subunit SecE [Anaplasma phagocytophilum]KJV63938.1 preprotein translocase, SecE subunit [Anaplasma phagocytophilum str. ApMUC09]KJV67049.1 preprotein translocase, SecE subunit [Anaplasma phagocytophilum str. ApNP]ABD43510.1 preprotein translocase, SecE subunit [Anaplasma phagocytophilum str. HZ]ANC34870.1 preprotein translocase subunit SecE [Anaplasma phagocytophilum str. Norway variant2]EOA61267.1 preprotein translocase subunit SecE [Anaplasma phagocytophilum str. HG
MIGSFAKFLLDVKQEVYQVSWASRKEVLVFLLVVILTVALSSVLFSCVDFVFLRLVKVMLGVIYEA